MDKFLEKWKNDKKYKAKIKLIVYMTFALFVTIYAVSINNKEYDKNEYLSKMKQEYNKDNNIDDILKINDTYNYIITIEIDDKKYEYSGTKDNNQTTIIKKVDNNITNYIYKNNEYYVEDDNKEYIITNKDNVYDIINYNYINIDTIKEYLKKAKKNNNQYLVYIKDIILTSDSDNYFIIDIIDNNIYIDYTPLIKEFNNDIKKYKVTIKIEE